MVTKQRRGTPVDTESRDVWLSGTDNPAVAVMTRRDLLGEPDSDKLRALWGRRNDYPPVAAILAAQRDDGSWASPAQDYRKYQGSLWQILFLGELWADGSDPRVGKGVEYAFSRQLADGSWSATNMRAGGSIPCLTANVGRSLARLGWARDERVVSALGSCVSLYGQVGAIDCREGRTYQLNGYCHMLAPKLLLFFAEVPRDLWPDGSLALVSDCIEKLRDKRVFRSLPEESREFGDALWSMPASERPAFRERFLSEHEPLHYKEKPGWLRFGYPLSYNSDALEALAALAAIGECRRPEYEPALELVRSAADKDGLWLMRNTLNGKMLADVEAKGEPSKWLTLRALTTLHHFES